MSAAVSTHTGAGPLSLMSCVRESSPPQDVSPEYENDKAAGPKKKFWNPRKWFKRKNHKQTEDISSPNEIIEPKDNLRSRSTSELSVAEEQTRRRSGTPMHPGLSVSHDSVFHSPHSSSELELDAAQSSSSLSIHHEPLQPDLRLQTELTERLRLRRGRGDTSEDDEGLPRSPCNSPTTTEGLLDKTAIKDQTTKSHSTCSEGSLLSMGSSEMDEDSFGQYSSHSSKISLYEKKNAEPECDLELGISSATTPLNHSAAHHRVSVRPKRTHGAPRRKRVQQSSMALPTTPEVNEDSSVRSLTPETNSVRETLTELYSSKSMSKTRVHTVTESQLKCSSLPPGLAAPGSEGSKLSRSRSNAGTKSQDGFSTLGEEDEEREDKKSDSFLGRLFPRRSGKKRKSKEEKPKEESVAPAPNEINNSNSGSNVIKTVHKTQHIEKRIETSSRPNVLIRSGPGARQRIQPEDLPASPDLGRRSEENIILPKLSPEKHMSTSPLQTELENHFRQRLASSLSTSPIKILPLPSDTPPQSPKSPRTPMILSPSKSPTPFSMSPPKSLWSEKQHITKSTNMKYSEIRGEKITEETKSKVKIAGLSAFQQRALSHSDEVDDGFQSLTELTTSLKPFKPVTKSQSFKSGKTFETKVENRYTYTSVTDQKSSKDDQVLTKESTETKTENKIEIIKAASLDSIKILEPNILENQKENKTKLEESKEPEKATEETAADIKEQVDEFLTSGITISGPSHKAIVNVGNTQSTSSNEIVNTNSVIKNIEQEVTQNEFCKETTIKEQQISVTKIQVKRESMQVLSKNTVVPEFFNIHLNKVEKPSNNVILPSGVTSPKIVDEQTKPKTPVTPMAPEVEPSVLETPRKFSTDDIEIVEKEKADDQDSPKHVVTALVTITTMTPPISTRIFKKNPDTSQPRKSSLVPANIDAPSKEKPVFKTKSSSLDMVESMKCDIVDSDKTHSKSEEKIEIRTKTQSVNDIQEVINTEIMPLRRKSVMKQKQDDEPELMKVFARRSLKLKDTESEQLSQQVIAMTEDSTLDTTSNKSRDSDKENNIESPVEERRKLSKELPKTKEPLIETKFVETTEVTLRKPAANNKMFSYQRTVSLNNPKVNEINNEKIHKQNSFAERPRTDHWFKVQDIELGKKFSNDEIITNISEKSDFINEEFSNKPKNFNQRKAEWEKRAQEALKKTVP